MAGRHRVVTRPAAHNPAKPFGDVTHAVANPPRRFGLDALQGAVDPLPDRLAPQSETSLPRGPSAMREPEEVEGPGTPLSPCPAVRHREPAEPDGAGFVRVRVGRVTPHTLRHSAAMELLHNGVDRATIALWLGHESVETTYIYPHADLELKRRAMARTTPAGTPSQSYEPEYTVLSFLNSP